MSKIALFYSFNPSNWISCQKIVFNLLKSYQAIEGNEFRYYHYNTDTAHGTLLNHIHDLKSWNADKVIILDHKPHPLPILTFLHQEYLMDSVRPDLFIHVYGDFSLYYKFWDMCSFLTHWKVRWFCASERQVKYLQQMLNDKDSVSLCPFPIDTSNYHFNQSIRDQQRKEWGVDKDQKVLIYTGRLSTQKRIHTLIKYFSQLKIKHPEFRLHLYGEFDNMADPFMGVWKPEGEYFAEIMRLIQTLSPEVQKDIYWFGGVSNDDLPRAYHGADLLVSFSVHHDEDYGMTVAEALSCGLPCLLTDWAGYGSFKFSGIEEWVKLVKVTIKPHGRLISRNELNQFSDELIPKLDQAPREKISKTSLGYFSIEKSSQRIQNELQSHQVQFKGFSPLLKRLSVAHQNFTFPFIDSQSKKINQLYKDTYCAYVRTN